MRMKTRHEEVRGRKQAVLWLRSPQPSGSFLGLSPLGPVWPPGWTSHLFMEKGPGALPFQIFLRRILEIPVEGLF